MGREGSKRRWNLLAIASHDLNDRTFHFLLGFLALWAWSGFLHLVIICCMGNRVAGLPARSASLSFFLVDFYRVLDVSVAPVHFPDKSRFSPKTLEAHVAGDAVNACKPKRALSSRLSPLSVCYDAGDTREPNRILSGLGPRTGYPFRISLCYDARDVVNLNTL